MCISFLKYHFIQFSLSSALNYWPIYCSFIMYHPPALLCNPISSLSHYIYVEVNFLRNAECNRVDWPSGYFSFKWVEEDTTILSIFSGTRRWNIQQWICSLQWVPKQGQFRILFLFNAYVIWCWFHIDGSAESTVHGVVPLPLVARV